MSKIRQRTKNLLAAGSVGALCAAIVLSGVFFYYQWVTGKEKRALIQDYESQIEELLEEQRQLTDGRQQLYVLKRAIKAGTVITNEDVTTIQISREDAPSHALDKQAIVGKISKLDLPKNSPLLASMLYEAGITPDDLRNQEFSMIYLPTDLETNQYVDVRIQFPSGHDYIVLTKKRVEKLNGHTVFYTMNEQEILFMSSAIVDAFLNGGRLYALSYVDPYMQEPAVTTYPPNPYVIALIEASPNIVEKASLKLESRMREQLEQELNEMDEQDKRQVINGRESIEELQTRREQAETRMMEESVGFNDAAIANAAPSYPETPAVGSGMEEPSGEEKGLDDILDIFPGE